MFFSFNFKILFFGDFKLMKIKTTMYRDFFAIEMKPRFLMKWVSHLNCVHHLSTNFLKSFLIPHYHLAPKLHHCSYIVLIGILKSLPSNKFKKCKIQVFKEPIVEKFGFFCRYSPSGPSQISDSYEEGSQQCERQADNS